MDFSPQIKQLLSSPSRVAIFLHDNPDSDCVCTAFALKNFLPKCEVDIYGKIFKNRFQWIAGIGEVKETVDTSIKYDHCFFLDAPTLKKVHEWKSALEIANNSNTWILDHHAASINEFNEVVKPLVFAIEPGFSSTCEILGKMLLSFCLSEHNDETIGDNFILPKESVILLLSGIYWETRRFRTSNFLTFQHISQMLEAYPEVNFESIDQDMGKTMMRFERYWAHCYLNSSKLISEARMMLIDVKWEHFRKHFYGFSGNAGLELYKREKHYTYLLDKALSLRMNEGGAAIERAVVFFPSKFKPDSEITIMYETIIPHTDHQHTRLTELGFKCPKADRRRYTYFGAPSRPIAMAIVEEILLITNEQQ